MTDTLFNLKYVNINVMRKAIKNFDSKDIQIPIDEKGFNLA